MQLVPFAAEEMHVYTHSSVELSSQWRAYSCNQMWQTVYSLGNIFQIDARYKKTYP